MTAVHRFMLRECRRHHPGEADLCVETVEKKTADQIDKFCTENPSLQGLFPPSCKEQLGSLLWRSARHLEQSLKRKLRPLGLALKGPHPLADSGGERQRGLARLIRSEARRFTPSPPPDSASPEAAPEQPVGKNIWEQPFGLFHSFTRVEEWAPLTTPVRFHLDGVPAHKTIEWYYWLQQNGDDGSYLLYWSDANKTESPAKADPHVTFKLIDGHIPNNLRLIYSEPTGLRPFVKD